MTRGDTIVVGPTYLGVGVRSGMEHIQVQYNTHYTHSTPH
jgi:hypothetical protein